MSLSDLSLPNRQLADMPTQGYRKPRTARLLWMTSPGERIERLAQSVARQIARADDIIQTLNRFAHSADHARETVDVGETVQFMMNLASRLIMMRGARFDFSATEQLHTNARIISATNADLQKIVESGTFRRDLYYRLNIFTIELPALKNRMEDLPHLINLFLANLNRKYLKNIQGVHAWLVEALRTYRWPSDMREIENVLEGAYIMESVCILEQNNFSKRQHMDYSARQLMENGIEPPLSEANQIAMDQF